MSESTAAPQQREPNEYEQERLNKRESLRALGVDPHGHAVAGITSLAAAKALYKPEHGADAGPRVTVAGRLVLKRDMGKLSFYTLRDDSGEDLQVGLSKGKLTEAEWKVLELLDLADIIVVRGNLGVTKKGEVTVWASPAENGPSLEIATKALLPPPDKHHGMTDVELRYRQRYVDLFTSPGVMKTMQLRIRIVDEIRAFLRGRGYLEVETPMLQPLHGGANARPFVTHHNALDMKLFMRIAPELYLKRLLVGGFSKVFEINRNFRNEGISPRHNPEFTMLEAYEAFGSWETMADLVEEMVTTVAEKVLGTLVIEHKDAAGAVVKTINLARPWRRVSMVELVAEETKEQGAEWKFDGSPAPASIGVMLFKHRRGEQVAEFNSILDGLIRDPSSISTVDFSNMTELNRVIEHFTALSPFEQLVEIYEKLVEPQLIQPTFVTRVPSVIIPLAKESREHPGFADVYELAINGQEISPGYTELNDPTVQEAQFRHQVGDEAEKQAVDEDFLNALKHGMPPAGGFGLGIDRLVMMLLGAESIRDVVLFPLMRPNAS